MKLLGRIGEGTAVQRFIFGLLGILFVLFIWVLLTSGNQPIVSPALLPTPLRVLAAFPQLLNENELLKNIGFSIGINLSGYLEAILITIPVGFFVGLIKFARWGFQRQIDAMRYIPLTALIGLFILWFGIYSDMKVHFLAFGILIYLLPVMIQRIDEVGDVYIKTVHTLGATDWQLVKTVYIPSVVSRLSDDIRVLTAISWTYIIVAETINSNQGGIGALIYNVGQIRVRPDKVFALLIIIMVIGVIQDKLFTKLDKELFPFKYQASEAVKSSRLRTIGLFTVIIDYILFALGWIFIVIYLLLMLNEYIGFLGDFKPLSYLFAGTAWVIHAVVIAVVLLKAIKWYKKRSENLAFQSVTAKATGQ